MFCVGVYAQDNQGLLTLFTTPQERQIINSNRYKAEKKKQPQQQTTATSETVAVRELIKDKVTKTFKISGISINGDGSAIAWVNGQAYETGATLDDGLKLRINNGAIKSVSIITPEGKPFTATSGENLDVTFLRTNQE